MNDAEEPGLVHRSIDGEARRPECSALSGVVAVLLIQPPAAVLVEFERDPRIW